MTSQRLQPHEHKPHHVYVLRASNDDVLYVGCSVNPDARIKSHLRDQPWRAEIDEGRTVITEALPWETARAVEQESIQTYAPRHNKQQTNGVAMVQCGVRSLVVQERHYNDAVKRGDPGAIEAREAWRREQARIAQEGLQKAYDSDFGKQLSEMFRTT